MKVRQAFASGIGILTAAVAIAASSSPADRPAVTDAFVQSEIERGRGYAIALLRSGAEGGAEPEDLAALQAAHLRHLFGLKASGDVLLAGPLPDHPEIRGLMIFATSDRDVVERLLAADPLVERGLLRPEVFTFFGMPGDGLR
jgi:uncharacterized protein YciI